MRIAWIVPGFEGGPTETGIPALSSLARAMCNEHDLHVFAVRYPPRSEYYRLSGVPVQSFGYTETIGMSVGRRRAATIRRWLRVVRALVAQHDQAPFDVIHGFWATESGMLAAIAGHIMGVPALVSCCGGELASVGPANYGSQLRLLEAGQVALTLHLATRIGVGSDDLFRRLRYQYPWLAGQTVLLPLGYDPAIFAPPPPSGSPIGGRIICVASWSPVKGHDLLLDALRLLVQRGLPAHLLLVGERTDGPAARAAVVQRGLQDHVSLLGAMSQTDVAILLGTAQVAAITSWHEAQCLAVVEALACGVPVVATSVGISRELLRDPVLGSCLAIRSPAALADALSQWLQLPVEVNRAAQETRQQAVAHLALPSVMESVISVYCDISAHI